MNRLCDLKYGIVGLGLMGGSIGKAIRERILCASDSTGKIYGTDINPSSLCQAVSEHVIDRGFSIEEVSSMLIECDVVFICLYPHKTVEFLINNKADFKSGSIITDISGVKAELFEHLSEFKRDDVDFIPGHPMAGSEKEGYSASNGNVFANHNYIIMPLDSNKKENVALLKNLVTEIGFTRIVETSAQIHDHKIAFTSQLCHVIASALVDSAEDTGVTAFGGGSFEDLTRIALINAPLWTELFLANRKELISHIENFEKSLSSIKEDIINCDAESLKSVLESVREKRSSMSRIDS